MPADGRLLGIRPETLGQCRRRAAGAGSRRQGHQHGRLQAEPDRGENRRDERPLAQTSAEHNRGEHGGSRTPPVPGTIANPIFIAENQKRSTVTHPCWVTYSVGAISTGSPSPQPYFCLTRACT